MTRLIPITGTVKNYAWGAPGGISAPLGQPPVEAPEAELWLGAHPVAPSRPETGVGTGAGASGASIDPAPTPALNPAAPWADLAAWERSSQHQLPFLLKLLAVGGPLSLQAHPDAAQGAAGYAREEAAGLPLADPRRNYRDTHGKPELLLAIEDGFEGLCGFRPLEHTVELLERMAAHTDEPALSHWRTLLTGAEDARAALRDAVVWLLSGHPSVDNLVAAVLTVLDTTPFDGSPEQRLVRTLAEHHPGDPGIALTLMLNPVHLRAGEALWLPPGQIHCYLSGLGVELMGPSDTVLRGGLTDKHVDVDELLGVLDFTPGPAPRVPAVPLGAHASAYRPRSMPSGADVPFELVHVTGEAQVETGAPSIALVLDGGFEVTVGSDAHTVRRGQACFADTPAPWAIRGSGSLYLATAVTH